MKCLGKEFLTFFSMFLILYPFLYRPLHFMKSVVKTYYSPMKRFCSCSSVHKSKFDENIYPNKFNFFKRPCTIMCFFKFEYRVGHYIFEIPEIFSINSSAFAVKCGLSNSKIFVLSI